ncbi:hypothetical protein [Kitasatospora cathayae]|uniref:Uncharacterized protein n=1 Tax=Kitasatospora cathayae TaxID=3004092 RepID=A0ABY7QEY5_9ACTN|nr:hypothetical protein [Kitasatospora sp. HUAS 3-15]WBP91270.1 hypothetical protein O1G21_38920 [Kitasatospora sp. HUAS 3-15]
MVVRRRVGVACGAGWRALPGGLAALVVPGWAAGDGPVFGGVVRR